MAEYATPATVRKMRVSAARLTAIPFLPHGGLPDSQAAKDKAAQATAARLETRAEHAA